MPTLERLELRVMSASLGVFSLALAYGLGALQGGGLGHCLQVAGPQALHCPLCYAAALFFAGAALPWSRRPRAAGA